VIDHFLDQTNHVIYFLIVRNLILNTYTYLFPVSVKGNGCLWSCFLFSGIPRGDLWRAALVAIVPDNCHPCNYILYSEEGSTVVGLLAHPAVSYVSGSL